MTDLLDSAGVAYVQSLAPALKAAAKLWKRAEGREDIRSDLLALVTSLLGRDGMRAWLERMVEK